MLNNIHLKAIKMYYSGDYTANEIAKECNFNNRYVIYDLLKQEEVLEFIKNNNLITERKKEYKINKKRLDNILKKLDLELIYWEKSTKDGHIYISCKCKKGHEHTSRMSSFEKMKECLDCKSDRISNAKKIQISNEIKNYKIVDWEEFKNNKYKYTAKCPSCNEDFKTNYYAMTISNYYKENKCPNCIDNKKYNSNELKLLITDLYNKNIPLNPGYMNKHYNNIYRASLRIYGNWKNIMIACGIDYERICKIRKWNKNDVKMQLKKLKESGCDLLQFTVRKKNSALWSAAINLFGSWDEALKSIGVNNETIRKDNRSKKDLQKIETFVKQIKALHEDGELLNVSSFQRKFPTIYYPCVRIFGSWEETLKQCNIKYEDIKIDVAKSVTSGHKFESLLNNILRELNIEFNKYKIPNKRIRPDYILKNDKWADSKLSESTILSCDTIAKYEPHCKLLIIIYMLGNPDRDEMITKKTRLMSVYKLIKQLPKHKQKYFINEIENIKIHSGIRKVIQLSLDNTYIREWNNQTEASKNLKISRSNIGNTCKGKRGSSGGFKWMYKEDYEKYISQVN